MAHQIANNYPRKEIVSLKRHLVPVVLPVVVLVALTGLIRLAVPLSNTLGRGGRHAPPVERRNGCEETFARYAAVGRAVSSGRDADALAQLGRLQNAPVRVDGNAFADAALRSFSPGL